MGVDWFGRALILLLIALILPLASCSCDGDDDDDDDSVVETADLVVRNATVFTSNSENPWAEAVAILDGNFIYVGENEGVENYIDSSTTVVDAEGNWVTPGFVDNHCHVVWMGAMTAMMGSLYGIETLEDVTTEVQAYAALNPEAEFVVAIGWNPSYIPGGRPDAEMADAIVEDKPLFLWGAGGHAGWVNTAALELMQERNLDAFLALDPEKDEEENYTGFIFHFYPFNVFDFFTETEIGVETIEAMAYAAAAVLDEALAVGVTTMNDVQIYKSFLPLVEQFKEAGAFDKVRLRLSYYVGPERWGDSDQLQEDLAAWQDWGETISDEQFVAGDSVKLYIDGVPGNYTAFMSEPYNSAPEETGEPVWSQEDFDGVTQLVDGLGLQMCTHGIGDAGIERIINSYAKLDDLREPWDSRHRVDHCEFPKPADVVRMGEHGIYGAVQPSHFFGADDLAVADLGLARLKAMMPWASMEQAGVNLSFGSDWVAAPINPFYGLIISALRMNYLGELDWGPEEAIELYSAIEHYTIDSAGALKMESQIGSIEVGKAADLAIFSISLDDIVTMEFLAEHGFGIGTLDDFVEATVVGGNIVYQK
jgi:predicted amidohydrolase YtcJ